MGLQSISKVAAKLLVRSTNKQFTVNTYATNYLRKSLFASTANLQKHFKVPLPALSPTMESGTIVSWEKKEGDQLNDGDLLAEIETDKATMGFETPEEGYLAKVVIPAGTKNVPLGKILCIIVDNQEEISQFKDYTGEGDDADSTSAPQETTTTQSPPVASTPTPPIKQSPPPPPPQPTSSPPSFNAPPRVFASPLAKKLAREADISLPTSGSGLGGRVVAGDLQQLLATSNVFNSQQQQQQPQQTQQEFLSSQILSSSSTHVDVPLTSMRQTIAKRLTQSKQSIPHYYLTVNLNVDELLKIRQLVNEMLAKDNIKLSVNDFIVKAASLACRQVPEVNSSFNETFIRQYNKVDVCFAVSTDAGLITPIIFDADSKGLKQIGVEAKGLAAKARAGKLQPNEFQGGTFTISNLGMFNINHFTAVINPPQAAILAVGSSQKTVVPLNTDEDCDQFKVVNTLNVTLSCDHRVVDGAVGAKWLGVFRKLIEQPLTMLL